MLRPHRRKPRKYVSFFEPPPLGEVARLAVTEGVRLIHFAMQKSCGNAPREAKNIRFCAENMVTFRHRVLLHPTSSGAPSQREPREHASASTSIIDRCHASTITSTIGGRHTTFPSLPPGGRWHAKRDERSRRTLRDTSCDAEKLRKCSARSKNDTLLCGAYKQSHHNRMITKATAV